MEALAETDMATAAAFEAEHYANPENIELVDTEGPTPEEEEDIQEDEYQPNLVEIDAFENEDEDLELDEDYKPKKGCWSGIDRFKDHSNSWATFKAHRSSGGLWHDPTFTADQTSLDWKMYGYPEGQSIPTNLVWKRPG